MKIEFIVQMTDGTTHAVSTVYADMVALEDKFDIDASELATRQRAKWMGYLAWHALKRSGETSEPFEKFIGQVESMSPVDGGKGD